MPEPPAAGVLAAVRGFAAPAGPLDLAVRQGELIVLRGPNGCGKTSLLRRLAGLPAPIAAGSVRLGGLSDPGGPGGSGNLGGKGGNGTNGGHDPASLPARTLAGLVHVAMQDPRDGLVGLSVAGEFRLRRQAMPPALQAEAGQEVARLSAGQARRVALAVATGRGGGGLLLLDEPAEGLDAQGRSMLLELVRRARTAGAVVAADHSGLLAPLADRIVELAPSSRLPLGPTIAGSGQPRITYGGETFRRGTATLRLPAFQAGPGLHAVTGPNGAGKSTILLRAAGLLGDAPCDIDGAPPQPGRTVALLPAPARELWTEETVAAELAGAEAATAARLVGAGLLRRHPLALSGGEAQRVALAKVLGSGAGVILLDEPEAHLDDAGRVELARLLRARVARGAAILMATHDPDFLALAQRSIEVAP